MPDLLAIASILLAITSGCFTVALHRVNVRARAELKRAAGEYVALLAAHDDIAKRHQWLANENSRNYEALGASRDLNRRLTAELADLRRNAYVRVGNAFKRYGAK